MAGPGRPRIPPEVKAERKNAIQILKAASPFMAARIVEIALSSRDHDVAIRACRAGLDKVVPNLEEVTNLDERPLERIPDEQLEAKLAAIRSSRNGNHAGTGEAA